ncbi:hypothetical protein BCV72DRAFT_335935 [Rhizopus microsporus var. microsporus]|uniref:Reverse transcriptase zinc-binding domain-containing protein n=1 Tax=Rhizopus microsporus var. microsporus TaxID=86635 RepID=A0A1X0R319_RHIZD|nr:hypothetical protein BCV72DRAFT_335935 [Rhizopus microsporus var. microsporus]
MSRPNFEGLLTVDLPEVMNFRNIILKLLRNSQQRPIDSLPSHYPRGSASAWYTFWLPSFPHQPHTVLWRYYHRKLPTRQRLYQLCPNRHLDPYCLLCESVEDDEHFLWSCSSTPIQVLSGLRVDGQITIACTIWAIWRYHWRSMSGGRTFWPHEVTARVTQAIKRIHDENAYRERLESSRSG